MEPVLSRDARKNKLAHGSRSQTQGMNRSKEEQKSFKRKASSKHPAAHGHKQAEDAFYDMQIKDPTVHYQAHHLPSSPKIYKQLKKNSSQP